MTPPMTTDILDMLPGRLIRYREWGSPDWLQVGCEREDGRVQECFLEHQHDKWSEGGLLCCESKCWIRYNLRPDGWTTKPSQWRSWTGEEVELPEEIREEDIPF